MVGPALALVEAPGNIGKLEFVGTLSSDQHVDLSVCEFLGIEVRSLQSVANAIEKIITLEAGEFVAGVSDSAQGIIAISAGALFDAIALKRAFQGFITAFTEYFFEAFQAF